MGWVYNLDKPLKGPSSQETFIGVTTTFFGLALLAVCLRIYVKIRMVKHFRKDDVAIIFAIVMSTGYWICGILQTRWGQGLSALDFPVENAVEFSKIQYAGSTFYTMGLLGFKLALLLAYLHIASMNKVYRTIVYIVLAATVVNQILFTCVLDFACRPIAFQWDPSIEGGSCFNEVPWFYALAATTLFFDVVIIILPLPVLYTLHLDRKRKTALMGVFALGFLVTAIQIIRMFSISDLKTWTDSKSLILWSQIELNLGILTTCIPTYAPLLRSFHALTSKTRGSKPQYGYPSDERSGSRPNNRHSSIYNPRAKEYTIRTEHSDINNAVDANGGVYALDTIRPAPTSDATTRSAKRATFGFGNESDVERGIVVHHASMHGDSDGGLGGKERVGVVRDGERGLIRATTEVRVEYDDKEVHVGAAY